MRPADGRARGQHGDRRGRPSRWSTSGAAGFQTGGDKTAAGDSIYLPPKGKVTFKVTAAKGTTLNFICAVHPWMIGTIKVK